MRFSVKPICPYFMPLFVLLQNSNTIIKRLFPTHCMCIAYIFKERDRDRVKETNCGAVGGLCICVSVCLCMCCRGVGCVGGIKYML